MPGASAGPGEDRTSGVARLLQVMGRSARRAQGRDGIVVEAFRGYGSKDRMVLFGRVFRQSPSGAADGHGLLPHLRDIARRVARRRVRGAPVEARFGHAVGRTRTDRDGLFRIDLRLAEPPPGGRSWHEVDLVVGTDPQVRATAAVSVPAATARLVVVSDIDDTVMYTGVANRIAMLWRLFMARAGSRVAFPGVAALYRALHDGPGGGEDNPVLYVSRAPWASYDMLTTFFRMHDIPVGPELFLREWGLSWRHPFPHRAEDHKRELIGHMLAVYPDLPFVLIGDSGQHDPEVYAGLVRDHPGRIRAVYIRNVSREPTRAGEIDALVRAVAASGSALVLAADSVAMAEHAAAIGLVGPETVREVSRERAAGDPRPEVGTVRAEAGDASRAALADADGSGTPPNVVVDRPHPDRQPGPPRGSGARSGDR